METSEQRLDPGLELYLMIEGFSECDLPLDVHLQNRYRAARAQALSPGALHIHLLRRPSYKIGELPPRITTTLQTADVQSPGG